MVRTVVRCLIAAIALVGVVALLTGVWFLRGGISAKTPPGRVETVVARRLRAFATPSSARELSNPVRATPDAVRAGMEHFADHCASCHANDGSGDTEIGRGLYPRAPDMGHEETQSLSDGELFYIIENGVRLTGMPAWGTGSPEGAEGSWQLVHFIRHLPKLTDAEREEMKALNPKSRDEWREEEEARRFLEGEKAPEHTPSAPSHKHGGSE